MAIPYYLIVNIGSMIHSKYVQNYPRHLILAQQWQKSKEYRAAVNFMRSPNMTPKRVILDNGAHEGIDIDVKEYADICLQSKPDVIVLTDLVGRTSCESRERALELVHRLDELSLQYGTWAHKYMYAPQGKDQDDILCEFSWAQQHLNPELYIIGVGQSYLRWETEERFDEEARYEMMCHVMNMPYADRMAYHILGARWRPINDFDRWPQVQGLDTIKPCTCALAGVTYPTRPARAVDRFSMDVVDERKLVANMVRLADKYELDLA